MDICFCHCSAFPRLCFDCVCFDVCTHFCFFCDCSYQPGSLGANPGDLKLVELERLEKSDTTEGDSGDEFNQESETKPLKDRFSMKLLLVPRCDQPTNTSGMIVYGTTAVICEFAITVFPLLYACEAYYNSPKMSGQRSV